MASKGVQDRVLLCAPTIWASFAYSEFVAEAVRRYYPELEARFHELSPEERAAPAEFISLPQYMRALGGELAALRDRMVAADGALDAERRALARARRRRDEMVETLYGRVVWARNQFEERVGRRRTTDHLQVEGETPRDPVRLLQVARRAAAAMCDENVELEEPMQGAVIAERVVADNLIKECDALEASLAAIRLAESGEKGAISVREQRIAAFDEFRGDVGRFLERLLELNGMPTLAATVRPELEGTGRRGRPSKKPPRDLFPDLVAAALALDPGAGLTLEEIRVLVPRRPVEYRRLQDVPSQSDHLQELKREAEAFRVRHPGREPGEREGAGARPLDRWEPEALGDPGAVERLKGWLAGIGRAIVGREE